MPNPKAFNRFNGYGKSAAQLKKQLLNRKRRFLAEQPDNLTPVITEQPQDQTVTVGETPTFSTLATVESGELTYQWQADTGSGFIDLPLETSATLTLAPVALSNNGKLIRARVSANGRSAVSRSALLVVSL